jgi:phosphoglycolate phosphatase
MRELFDAVVGGDRGLARKPDPEMLDHLWRETGLLPSESVLIGDSEVDILAARAAGCTSIAVAWGYTPISALRSLEADALIEEISELSGVLLT